MSSPNPSVSPPGHDDPLGRERERFMYALSILAVACLLPFAVHNFVRGRNLLAWGVLGVVVPVALDGWAIHAGRKPPIPYALLLLPISFAITLSLALQGVIGAFWCYPTVLFFFFVLRRRTANLCSVALLLLATAMVHRFLGVSVTVRFAASLVLTIFIVNVIQDIVGQLQRRLVEQAITDPLTGTFNRRYMQERLAEALESGRRRPPPASVLIIDIDHFKRVNDQHGHKAGDTVLQGLVSAIRRRARAVDLLFRMGGEEFVLLLPDTPEDDAFTAAESLRAAIAQTPLLDGLTVTVSIG
ncbi:MAG TPA: GGDEF domain-containing protein, partial [Vicinamibacteria bacterium]|nr:GGDEF domain-containing protein [Vicinamibacteria bacterium]